jgi:hypothetical protein
MEAKADNYLGIGSKVIAIKDLNEDDWWETAWDLERDPWQVPATEEGVITGYDRLPYFYIVDFQVQKEVVVYFKVGDFDNDVIPVAGDDEREPLRAKTGELYARDEPKPKTTQKPDHPTESDRS